jgi:hypothetical protein
MKSQMKTYLFEKVLGVNSNRMWLDSTLPRSPGSGPLSRLGAQLASRALWAVLRGFPPIDQ